MAGYDKNSAKCLTEAQLVTLLHDEMPESERFGFEEHLLDCSKCVDEFAVLSEAHLSVSEWNRDVFAFMETPAIEIPHAQAAETPAWLDGVYAGFAGLAGYGMPIASMSAVTVIFVLGYFLLSYRVSPSLVEQPLVSEAVMKIPATDRTSETKVDDTAVAGDTPKYTQVSINETKRRSIRPAVRVQKAVLKRPAPAIKPDALVAEQSPRLTNNTDLSDTSLRLMDLFSELDVNE